CMDQGHAHYNHDVLQCRILYPHGTPERTNCLEQAIARANWWKEYCPDARTRGLAYCDECWGPHKSGASLASQTPVSTRDQIIQLLDQTMDLLANVGVSPLPANAEAELDALLAQADELAGGDAAALLGQDSAELERELAADEDIHPAPPL